MVRTVWTRIPGTLCHQANYTPGLLCSQSSAPETHQTRHYNLLVYHNPKTFPGLRSLFLGSGTYQLEKLSRVMEQRSLCKHRRSFHQKLVVQPLLDSKIASPALTAPTEDRVRPLVRKAASPEVSGDTRSQTCTLRRTQETLADP